MSYPPPPPPQQPGPYGAPQQPQYGPPQQPQYGAPPPYQYGGGQPPYQPPPAQKGGRGCLVAALIGIVVLLLVCGVGGFFVWRVANDVKDTVENAVPGLGGAKCPSEGDVSDTVGTDVSLDLSGNVVVAAGCYYSGGGLQITLAKGSGVIADDEIQGVRDEAQAAGVKLESIDPGDDGVAYARPTVVDAITKSGGALYEVEIDASGGKDVSDELDAAVDVLQDFIDVQ